MAPTPAPGAGGKSLRRLMIVAEGAAPLHSLSKSLAPMQGDWEIHATQFAVDALGEMDNTPFDILIVDSRVKGMSCDELLVECRRRHPNVVRIALVAQTDQATLLRLVAVAHRILSNPCDENSLQDAVRRAHSLRELLWSPSLTAVVGRIGNIPTLSTLYNRIAAALSHPDFSLSSVGELVEQDAGIAAKVMQVANSALLGLRRPAASPSQAVRVLGADLTRTLVLAADLFSRYDPAALRPFSIDALWEHSRRVADLAGRIATVEHAGERIVREASVAGLFHDIGRLTIASQLPGPYKEVLTLMRTDGIPGPQAEWRVLGSSHAEIGGYLLGLWGLPDGLVEAVAWHHDPSSCPGTTFSALTAVHAAEFLISSDEGADPDEEYLERLGLMSSLDTWKALVEVSDD
jgi:HD-like signal output (HDOD) protein/CheY-like chemotaxis protein